MSANKLCVYLDGTLCGWLNQSPEGQLSFRYSDDYRIGTPTPLSMSMPVGLLEHKNKAVRAYLMGLLTDNDNARHAIANRFGVSENNPFAILRYIGHDVPGAVQILPEGTKPTDQTAPNHFDMLSNAEVEEQLLAVVEEFEIGKSPTEILGNFSLPGAQPKIALFKTSRGRWATPKDGTPTTHILKPNSNNSFRRIDVNEFMTMKAASKLGLNTATTELATFGDTRVFVTERYDRVVVDGHWRRLHQEDLCQALSVPPDKKYQEQDGGPGVAKISQLLQTLPRIEDRKPALWAFFQGLMFNVALECTDAHAKNYSILLDHDSVKLAPLYDLITYAPYKRGDSRPKSAMRIKDKYQFSQIGMDDCLSVAAQLKVDQHQAREFIETLRKRAIGAFEEVRDELKDVDANTKNFARDLVDQVSTIRKLKK